MLHPEFPFICFILSAAPGRKTPVIRLFLILPDSCRGGLFSALSLCLYTSDRILFFKDSLSKDLKYSTRIKRNV